MSKITSLVFHGSILTTPDTARDIDVVVSGRATDEILRAEAIGVIEVERIRRGWPKLPVDVQVGGKIPGLPFCAEPVQEAVIGERLLVRRMFDLAAWARACDISEEARQQYKVALVAHRVDSRRVDVTTPRIILVPQDSELLGVYHGGGPVAMQAAREKAPAGWCYCLSWLPPLAVELISTIVEGQIAPLWFRRETVRSYYRAAPGSSNGELVIYSQGLDGAYAEKMIGWDGTEITKVRLSELINLTPHALRLYAADGKTVILELPPSGHVCRVKTEPQVILNGEYEIDSFPVVTLQRFSSEVIGLPDPGAAPRPIVVSIVGAEKVAEAWPGLVYATDTGPDSAVRDSSGQILGVKRLQAVIPIAKKAIL